MGAIQGSINSLIGSAHAGLIASKGLKELGQQTKVATSEHMAQESMRARQEQLRAQQGFLKDKTIEDAYRKNISSSYKTGKLFDSSQFVEDNYSNLVMDFGITEMDKDMLKAHAGDMVDVLMSKRKEFRKNNYNYNPEDVLGGKF